MRIFRGIADGQHGRIVEAVNNLALVPSKTPNRARPGGSTSVVNLLF